MVRIRLSTAAGRAPKVQREQVVAKKIPWRDDKAALVIGPTGAALAKNGTLYVADTLESRIIAIPDAMTRTTALVDKGIALTSGGHLNQPLGLILAPDGDILSTNAGDGNIVETTPSGDQVRHRGRRRQDRRRIALRSRDRTRRQGSALRRRRVQHPATVPLSRGGDWVWRVERRATHRGSHGDA